jgi:hypothetical protein
MRNITLFLWLPLLAGLLFGCGGGPTSPSNPMPPTQPTPPASSFRIDTLITVYQHENSGAFWSRAQTTTEKIGKVILGVDDLSSVVGTTDLNNEGGRVELQAAIDRMGSDFQDSDYQTAFGETRTNLERFINDADNDSWSIDGRNGRGKDWPHDSNGNDPDGWTGQIVITVTKLQ